MQELKNTRRDLKTKEAWQKNWEDISIAEILKIFDYERVKKQMQLYLRVLPKDEKILEGGCGLGPYLIKLRELGYDVEGIDYNEEPIRRIRQFNPALPASVGDVSAIKYPDGYFGGYLSLGVIEHFTEGPRKAIQEAHRVLKRGGGFVVAVPRHHLFMKIMAPIHLVKSSQFLRKLFHRPSDHHYWEQHFKKKELQKILEEEGFEVREIHPMDHSHSWVSFSRFFRDKRTYDEANSLGLRLGRWSEKYLPWSTAAQMTLICYKKGV